MQASLAAPAMAVADCVPLIGPLFSELIGCGAAFAACIISIPITSLVVATAWLFYRPLLSLGVITCGAVLVAAAILVRRKLCPVQEHQVDYRGVAYSQVAPESAELEAPPPYNPAGYNYPSAPPDVGLGFSDVKKA